MHAKPCAIHMYNFLKSTPIHRRCSSTHSHPCHISALGKQVALPHQKVPNLPEEHAECPGVIISTDLLTLEVPSIGGALGVLTVTDMSTCYHWTTPLKLKSDAMDKHYHMILSMPETHHPLAPVTMIQLTVVLQCHSQLHCS